MHPFNPRKTLLLLPLLALFPTLVAGQPGGEYRIIVHPDNPVTVISKQDLSDLFLRKTKRWRDGADVEVVDLHPESPARSGFSRDIHGRSTDRIEAYWTRQIFSGREVPPEKLQSDAEVLAAVRRHPGAIGYVSAWSRLEGVKAIDVLTPPEPVDPRPVPRYTDAARRLGAEGVVRLRVAVDETGRVSDVEVLERLAGGLDREAVQAVRRWKFKPAMVNGERLAGHVNIPIRFSIE